MTTTFMVLEPTTTFVDVFYNVNRFSLSGWIGAHVVKEFFLEMFEIFLSRDRFRQSVVNVGAISI